MQDRSRRPRAPLPTKPVLVDPIPDPDEAGKRRRLENKQLVPGTSAQREQLVQQIAQRLRRVGRQQVTHPADHLTQLQKMFPEKRIIYV